MLFRTKKEIEEMKASSECTSCPVLTRCRTLAEHHMTLADYDKQLPKLLSVSAMEKQLGKEKFDKLLLDLTEKPEGKMELAPVTDTRAEVLIGGEE